MWALTACHDASSGKRSSSEVSPRIVIANQRVSVYISRHLCVSRHFGRHHHACDHHRNVAITIVQDVLRKGCPHIHKACLESLCDIVRAAFSASSHTLSNLARALDTTNARAPGAAVAVRHRVKRVDRLLGNRALQRDRTSIYAAMAQFWLHDPGSGGATQTSLILVDWSDLNEARSAQLIRASVALQGRSLTLYEEEHTMKVAHVFAPKVHAAFLKALKAMLPSVCQLIVITDAGFRSPWFRAIEAIGWHWVGRIRNRDMVRPQDSNNERAGGWQGAKTLYARATSKALDLGLFDYVRSHPISPRLVTIKHAPKGRHMMTLRGERTRSSHNKKKSTAESEPWLLAASIGLAHLSAEVVVAIYAQRMQIEQAFRDTKNPRLGLGLSYSGSRSTARWAALALVASLAEFVIRLTGQCAANAKMQHDLQLTNRRKRAESSVIRVGMLLLRDAFRGFNAQAFRQTIKQWASPHPVFSI